MPNVSRAAPAPASSPTRAGLSAVLLLYFLGVILVITLAPFHFRVPKDYAVRLEGKPFDVVTNVLLFFPLGFLYPLTRPSDREPSPVEIFGLGLLLSACIEASQWFDVGRVTSLVDVITNGGGAFLGALASRVATRRVRIDARHVGRLSLEIPLVGLIYLLLPLLLALSMRAVGDPLYLLPLAAVVFIATRLVSAVQRHHFAPAGLFTNAQAGAAAALWIFLGTFPMLQVHRVTVAALVAAAGMVTWQQSTRALPGTGERRFESAALRTVRPLLAVLVLCVVCLPLASGYAPWTVQLALPGNRGDVDLQMLQLLVPAATLTVFGYLVAEARGRRELSFAVAARRIALECALVALALETARGFQPGVGASVSQFVVTVAAGVLGAGIYHSQRDHVRWILANRAATGRRSRPSSA